MLVRTQIIAEVRPMSAASKSLPEILIHYTDSELIDNSNSQAPFQYEYEGESGLPESMRRIEPLKSS